MTTHLRHAPTVLTLALSVAALAGCASVTVSKSQAPKPAPVEARATPSAPTVEAGAMQPVPHAEPEATEHGILEHQVQLTFAKDFHKAGESYFSPDSSQIIFQAIEPPAGGAEPGEFYSMYVADVVRDGGGRITGIDRVRRLSPEGSANTCGWFHPTQPGVVLFATTMGPPSPGAPPGYDRSSGRYRWMFPPEMRVVRRDLRTRIADGSPASLTPVVGDGDAYCAEGAVSPDGRHFVYCSLESGDGDLYVLDMQTGRSVLVVGGDGYDGGPFISPDGKRICYRSDRMGNHLLQLYVADLAFDAGGAVTGIEREYQLTDNKHVNWGPYWHPGGRHLVYATSEIGHRNYEIYLIDADPGDLPGSSGAIKYGTRKRRVTHADRADVLPTFSPDGKTMIWTSQRGADGKSQIWVADFVIELDPDPAGGGYDASQHKKEGGERKSHG